MEYVFDESAANRVVDFFSRFLTHTKGEWAGQPFVLMDWQKRIVRDVFGWKRPDGTRRYRWVYIEVPRKNGKALDINTMVPTSAGWKSHGDLRPGDLVFGPDGRPVRVIASTPAYEGPCMRLSFSDGTQIVSHVNHEWVTERSWYTKRPHGARWPMPTVTTTEIRDTLRGGSRGDLVHRIPVASPLALPERELLIDPYVLGAWLGDGHSGGAVISCADAAILDECARRGYESTKYAAVYAYGLGKGHLQVKLHALGLINNKHIPASYLRAAVDQRRDLLRGLMDTDGYVSAAGQCELVLTSKALFDSAVELIRSLGLKVTVKTDRAMLNGKDCGPRYRAQFWAFADDPPVLLARKVERLKTRPTRRTRTGTLMITAVEPVGERLVNCIQVEGGLYLAGPGMVQTHNSAFVSGLGLYLTIADGEAGAEVYAAAADRDQAAIVFDEAKRMLEASPLARFANSFRRSVVVPESNSSFRVLSSDAPTKHGLNAHAILFDELHAQPNRELWDVLATSIGAREQPLVIAITTAGYDRQSICWEQHEYARKVLDGVIEDDSYYAYIAAADEDDDWTDPAVWAKANPSYGITVKEDYLRNAAEKAQHVPAYQNTFRRLHLNQWTQQEERWLDMAAWEASAGEVEAEALWEQMAGRPCYGGLDLASTNDVAAFVMVFPLDDGSYAAVPRFWIPRENMIERARRDRVPYDGWARDGYITPTPGNVIDFGRIMADIVALGEVVDIREIAFDRWGAVQVSLQLDGEGFTMVQFGQGYASMASPTKELLRLVLEGKLRHGMQPVLRWMADNMVVTQDPAGNVKPDKKRSREKIDGMVALIMALDRALRNEESGSVYEERGLVLL